MTNRPKYETRKLRLATSMVRDTVIHLVNNAPLDPINPLEVVIREFTPVRKNTQNALMWAGALKDIAEQAWIDGRQFSSEVWHEHFKREYLPEEYQEGKTREGYKKWDVLPSGERVLVGSTGDLLTAGFSEYLEKVYAFGANLGVMFKTVREY